MRRLLTSRVTRVTVFMACLGPLEYLGWRGLNKDLTANPIEFITHLTGDWTLCFLLITLAVTPLRLLLRLPELIRFRRMLGLFAFSYGVLHLITFVAIDHFFDWSEIVKDVVKRPFVTAGFTGMVLLVPLAVTSTRGWIRRLGGERWQALHRLVYLSSVAGVIHYCWLVKSDVSKPIEYGIGLAALLVWRVIVWAKRHRAASQVTSTIAAAEMSD